MPSCRQTIVDSSISSNTLRAVILSVVLSRKITSTCQIQSNVSAWFLDRYDARSKVSPVGLLALHYFNQFAILQRDIKRD